MSCFFLLSLLFALTLNVAADVLVGASSCGKGQVAHRIRISQSGEVVLWCKEIECKKNAVRMKILRLGKGEFYKAGRLGRTDEYDVIQNVHASKNNDNGILHIAYVYRVVCDSTTAKSSKLQELEDKVAEELILAQETRGQEPKEVAEPEELAKFEPELSMPFFMGPLHVKVRKVPAATELATDQKPAVAAAAPTAHVRGQKRKRSRRHRKHRKHQKTLKPHSKRRHHRRHHKKHLTQ